MRVADLVIEVWVVCNVGILNIRGQNSELLECRIRGLIIVVFILYSLSFLVVKFIKKVLYLRCPPDQLKQDLCGWYEVNNYR